MNVWIGERRGSISDEYLRRVKRETLIKEQVRSLRGVASEEEIASAMGKLYDTLHPRKKKDE